MRADCEFKKFLLVLCMVCGFSVLTACGGGGDDDGGGETKSLSYTGSTEKTVIDDQNAVDISSTALNGGIQGTVFNGIAGSMSYPADTEEATRSNTFSTSLILQDAISQLKDVASSSSDLDRAVVTRQETIDGECGGSASGTISVDNQTGSFSGTMVFAAYCDSDVLIDGSATFSGTMDLDSEEFSSLTIEFDYLQASDASGSYVFDGSIQMSVQSSAIMITISMYLEDGSNDYVFWLNNYQMSVEDYWTYFSMTISGDFYYPDYGYVSLSTEQTLIIDASTGTPSSGVLIVTGENGSAGGPTEARLTCYSGGQFQVEADTDGDGVYDWTSDMLSWDSY